MGKGLTKDGRMMYMDTADEWMEDVQRMEGAWFDDRWRVGGG